MHYMEISNEQNTGPDSIKICVINVGIHIVEIGHIYIHFMAIMGFPINNTK